MGTRGRQPIQVTHDELQGVIAGLEATEPFANRSKLYAAIANTEWAKTRSPRPLTAQVAMLFVTKRFPTLTVKTPVAKRGRIKGSGPVPNAGKRRKKRMPADVKAGLHKVFGASLESTVNRAASGHLRSAVKLLCIDCCGGSKGEVALCTIKTCPLWTFRPYKKAPANEATAVSNPGIPVSEEKGSRQELPMVDSVLDSLVYSDNVVGVALV